MRKAVLKELFDLAAKREGPFSAAVLACMKDAKIPVPVDPDDTAALAPMQVALAAKLKEAKLEIKYVDGKAGKYCNVFAKRSVEVERDGVTSTVVEDVVVANGYSNTAEDAFMHAVIGAVREEPVKGQAATPPTTPAPPPPAPKPPLAPALKKK